LASAASGCFSPGDGVTPPLERLYFPVGLALDSTANHLFVANSDFDLQYNAGTLQSYDLERLRAAIPKPCGADSDCSVDRHCDLTATDENVRSPSHYCVANTGPYANLPCGALGESSDADRVVYPGRCKYVDPASFIVDTVETGAFATDVLYRQRPDGTTGAAARLFLPVRGDATLHWADVDDSGHLDCGQVNNDGACDADHRRGDDAEAENTRGLTLPAEPYGIDATADGRALVITHQTKGTASLFINDWTDGPTLQFLTTGLSDRPIGVAAVPAPALADVVSDSYQPGFLVTYRTTPEVDLLRFFDDGVFDGGSAPARPYLAFADRTVITANSSGEDSRGIVVDDAVRYAAEQGCRAQFPDCAQGPSSACALTSYTECLRRADSLQPDVYVANRAPSSLLVGSLESADTPTLSNDLPAFYTSVPLTFGPSRIVLGNITNPAGEPERRVFAVCFDSRQIFIYDPARRRTEKVIETGRGPQALAVDAPHGLAYVAHFTDSYIGVISLDQRYPASYGTIIASVGRPSAPRASK
jgi:DNA-binding beta-propeller fold protein YncE